MEQSAEAPASVRTIREISEREIAMALVLELAESGDHKVSLMGFYDDDLDFIMALAARLGVVDNRPFRNKLVRVARELVRVGALDSKMFGTGKEYLGEPSKTQAYWLPPGKAGLLTRGRTEVTMDPEGEAAFLIRRAYPAEY